MKKFILVDPSFDGVTGDKWQYAVAFARSARINGYEFILLSARHSPKLPLIDGHAIDQRPIFRFAFYEHDKIVSRHHWTPAEVASRKRKYTDAALLQRQRFAAHVHAFPERLAAQQHRVAVFAEARQQRVARLRRRQPAVARRDPGGPRAHLLGRGRQGVLPQHDSAHRRRGATGHRSRRPAAQARDAPVGSADERDREQAGRDLLAGGHHRVVFARVVHRRHGPGPVDQLVRGAGHGGNHHRHLVADPAQQGHEITVGGATILPQHLWILAITLVIIGANKFYFYHTISGKAMRACSYNRRAAGLVGIDVRRMVLFSFIISSAMGSIAGIIVAPLMAMLIQLAVSRPGAPDEMADPVAVSNAVWGGDEAAARQDWKTAADMYERAVGHEQSNTAWLRKCRVGT